MSLSVSYELLSLRGGSWVIESVYDSKDVALQEARRLLESRHQKAVKVIEETYDADTDDTKARIVFSRKNEEKPRQKSREENEEKSKTDAKAAPAALKTQGDPAFMKYILILVFSVGGILFGAIALVFWYLQALGSA